MSDRVRIIGGFVEINYERFAQVLPGKDERTLADEILGHPSDYDRGREDGYDEGHSDGFSAGEEEGREETFNRLDTVLDRLVKQEIITQKQCETILEALDG